ncbi:MAG TPA: YicC/YloC family endoribonuclease [Candidatus Polarisedimenticolia bacterium]|jgi:uncharacterized protein (TIGR00255 family)|nr:YicC/YloC family endoribonuclease [Candidatus Polarisedimenticolia bacterium]
MIKSMTGFGRGEASDEAVRYEVEVRGVNHRFLEIRFRLPQEIAHFEMDLRSHVARSVRRGRLDVTVDRAPTREPETVVTVNRDIVSRYLQAATELAREFQLPGALTLESALALPGAVRFEVRREAAEAEQETLHAALDRALESFDAARAAEGGRMEQDLRARLGAMEEDLRRIETSAAGAPQELTARLRKRLAELADAIPLDEMRLAQEAAYLAGRSDITEEIVRLRAHLRGARDLLAADGSPVGKSLDFLVQEMNRETNTIGSKSENLEISQVVLRLKSEVEKVREQIQNLE